MTQPFDPAVIAAVLRHMNDDHTDDNVLIARAFGPDADITDATMTGFDADGGEWDVRGADGTVVPLRVAWPAGRIAERAEVRREIVALYDEACRRTGIEPRPHS